MRLTTSHKVATAFAVALVVLIGLGWASYYTPRRLIELTAARRRTLQFLEQLALFQSCMNDAETGQRGYLLTGDLAYLGPYHQAQERIESILAKLHQSASGDGDYSEQLATLDSLVHQKLAELARTIELARSDPQHGRERALAVVRTGRGKRLMDQIRQVVAKVTKSQEETRNRQLADTERVSRNLQLVSMISPLALVFVGVSGWLTLRDLAARTRSEQAIQHLNETLAATNQGLEAANKELEAFSYSVSHDLRAPLRAIEGFSRIVLEDYAPGLDDDAKDYLTQVRNNTLRMGQLIDDLLALSRLGRKPLKKEDVSNTRLVQRCLEELKVGQNGRKIEIRMLELPDCQADPSLLKQVWTNLLSNALKYTGKRETAEIEIGCRREGASEPVYFVKDNGVGFDMRYANKLFGVFQRLHRIEDYEGTGVGLAIVQRIINRHGGRIWAESALEQGATFFFTLEEGVFSNGS